MVLSINQILVIVLLLVLFAMLVVLGVMAVKAVQLMKKVETFTEEYQKLAVEAGEVIEDARETISEGTTVFAKSLTTIAVSSLALDAVRKFKKIRKLLKK